MTETLVLHPGEMGSSLAACLLNNGHRVTWVSEGRSPATFKRANREGLVEYPTLHEALAAADLVLSICPPEFAEATARQVVAHGFDGLYVDANATSPMTAERIASLVGTAFVDGSVIGPPARRPQGTRCYFSGGRAKEVVALFEGSYANPRDLGDRTSAASALKMCYAAYTKGTSALLLNIRALAEHVGVADALINEWSVSQPDLFERTERVGPSVSRKAWRFAEEMSEIASTFRSAGLPSEFHEGASAVYQRLAGFKERPPAATEELLATLLRGP